MPRRKVPATGQRYRVTWNGPWDARDRPERVLTMWANNKPQALKLHKSRFPCRTVKVQPLGRS